MGEKPLFLHGPYPGFPNILPGIFLCPLDAAVTQKYSQAISVGFCSRLLLYQTWKATSWSAKLYGFSPINQLFFYKGSLVNILQLTDIAYVNLGPRR